MPVKGHRFQAKIRSRVMYKRFVPLLLLSVCLHLHAVDSDIRILTIFTPQYAANEGVEKLNLEITALL